MKYETQEKIIDILIVISFIVSMLFCAFMAWHLWCLLIGLPTPMDLRNM